MNVGTIIIRTGLKAALGQNDLLTDQNTRPFRTDYMVGDPMHEMCIPHRIPRAW